MNNIIKLENIKKYFYKKEMFFSPRAKTVKAVDDVSFCVEKGTTFGLVGGSGSGKTTIAKLIVGILKPDSGNIEIGGTCDIVFQDPFSSLNPRMRVEDIIGESLLIKGTKKTERRAKVENVLKLVRMDGSKCLRKYPHQFSGGERQRIGIARALVRQPDILILDEPVSSLDVSIQAGILNLLKDLQESMHLTYVFVSHDLRVIEFMSDIVGIMKDGRLLEVSPKDEIYRSPKSPYTKELLGSIPEF
ncbi:MAG: ATP-binding cassette domain-containing protein [Candidatus Omnitrophica bacterium]|nr:ATP-binding cassette domain-containing protein [Candidatus Omnitrophota bacterium]